MSLLTNLMTIYRLKIVRYFIAGVATSLGYTITVVIMVEWGWLQPAAASAASFLLWTPVSYIAHRDFTFCFDGANPAAGLKFVVMFLLKFAASGLVVAAAIVLNFHYIVGVLMNWVVLPLITYFVLKLWVFQERNEANSRAPLRARFLKPRG